MQLAKPLHQKKKKSEKEKVYLTKLSSRSVFLRSLINSPIIFLSRRGFSLNHWATSLLSMGLLSRPFSCRIWMPFLGFWLNCSVPVIRSFETKKKKPRKMSSKCKFEGSNIFTSVKIKELQMKVRSPSSCSWSLKVPENLEDSWWNAEASSSFSSPLD